MIAAHDSLIAAMNFSPSGEKLATASEKVSLYTCIISCYVKLVRWNHHIKDNYLVFIKEIEQVKMKYLICIYVVIIRNVKSDWYNKLLMCFTTLNILL